MRKIFINTAIQNKLLTDRMLHVGEVSLDPSLANPEFRKNNYGSNRNPISTDVTIEVAETDGLFDGYREGSEWYNNITLSKWVCLEATSEITRLSEVVSASSVLTTGVMEIKDGSLAPFLDGEVEISDYLYIEFSTSVNIASIQSILVINYGNILSGWVMKDNHTIMLPRNSYTLELIGMGARVSLVTAATLG